MAKAVGKMALKSDQTDEVKGSRLVPKADEEDKGLLATKDEEDKNLVTHKKPPAKKTKSATVSKVVGAKSASKKSEKTVASKVFFHWYFFSSQS